MTMTIHDVRNYVGITEPASNAFVVQKQLLFQLLCCAEIHLSRPVAVAITRQEQEGPVWDGQIIREYY